MSLLHVIDEGYLIITIRLVRSMKWKYFLKYIYISVP